MNATTFQSDMDFDKEPTLPVAYAAVELTVAIIAVVGNLAVVICFTTERRLRRLTNYYILSLAAADLLVGLIGVPSAIMTRLGIPMYAPRACIAMLSFLIVLCTVSILNLIAVSVDRYWAIVYPMAYQRYSSGHIALWVISACWVLGAIIGFLPLFGWNSIRSAGGLSKYCLFMPVMDYSFLVFLYFATIVYPAVLLAFFYVRIYVVIVKQLHSVTSLDNGSIIRSVPGAENGLTSSLQRHDKKDDSSCSPAQVQHHHYISKREVRTAKTLFSIVICFMICWLPLYSLNCVVAFCRQCKSPEWLFDSLIILSHANSAVNPFLYAYQMKDFRASLQRRFFSPCTTKNNSPHLTVRLTSNAAYSLRQNTISARRSPTPYPT